MQPPHASTSVATGRPASSACASRPVSRPPVASGSGQRLAADAARPSRRPAGARRGQARAPGASTMSVRRACAARPAGVRRRLRLWRGSTSAPATPAAGGSSPRWDLPAAPVRRAAKQRPLARSRASRSVMSIIERAAREGRPVSWHSALCAAGWRAGGGGAACARRGRCARNAGAVVAARLPAQECRADAADGRRRCPSSSPAPSCRREAPVWIVLQPSAAAIPGPRETYTASTPSRRCNWQYRHARQLGVASPFALAGGGKSRSNSRINPMQWARAASSMPAKASSSSISRGASRLAPWP